MICDGEYYRNLDTDKIIFLMDEWNGEYFMGAL